MKMFDHVLTFNSGKTLDICGGIIGIDSSGNVFEGYDGTLYRPDAVDSVGNDEAAMSPEERVELAEFMILRWAAFIARALTDQKANEPR